MKRALKIGFILALAALGLAFSHSLKASGPTLYFQTDTPNVAPGSEFRVTVMANSPEQINALNLQISYSADIAELKYVETQNSFINFWQDSPRSLAPGVLRLEGGASTSFAGVGGEVVSLVFQAIKAGNLALSLQNGNFYLADGQATPVTPQGQPFQMEVSLNGATTTVAIPQNAPPPELQVETANLPNASGTLIIFNAEDKSAGVNYVALRSISWFLWSGWQIVQNPVLEPIGAWAIQLEAVNRSNEATVQTIYVWPEIFKKGGPIFLVLILLIVFGLMFYNKYRRRRL